MTYEQYLQAAQGREYIGTVVYERFGGHEKSAVTRARGVDPRMAAQRTR